MRHPPEAWLIAALSTFALTGVVAMELDERFRDVAEAVRESPGPNVLEQPDLTLLDGAAWFAEARPFCNAVEVETRMGVRPPPASPDGLMYQAACYALAGRTDRARKLVDLLPNELRPGAAGVIFEAGHPAADAGDDVAAGPLMEIVVDYWPNHYMALYHAGAARYELADHGAARRYLERFLAEYPVEDGWRSRALGMLAAMPAAAPVIR